MTHRFAGGSPRSTVHLITAGFSSCKVRCVGCRNLIGLEQSRILDEGSVCCSRCYEHHREVLPASLTSGSVELVG